MKFVVDVQLPERVARWLQASGHLERLFQHNLESIIQAFNECDFIELQRTALICRL